MNNEMVLPPREEYFLITSLWVCVTDCWDNIMANNFVYADLCGTVWDLKWRIARRMGYPIAYQHRVFTANRVEIFDHQILLPFLKHPHAQDMSLLQMFQYCHLNCSYHFPWLNLVNLLYLVNQLNLVNQQLEMPAAVLAAITHQLNQVELRLLTKKLLLSWKM